MNEFKGRGLNDAVVDGLENLPEAITTMFPETVGADLDRASDACATRCSTRRGRTARRWPLLCGRPTAPTRQSAARRLRCRTVGNQVPVDRAELATQLGSGGSVLSFRAAGTAMHHRRTEETTGRMAGCQGAVRHPVRRAVHHRSMILSTGSHTRFLTHPIEGRNAPRHAEINAAQQMMGLGAR